MEINNIIILHKEEVKNRRRKFNETFYRERVKENCMIKKKFFNKEFKEHLWVRITKIRRNGLMDGEIISFPILLDEFNYKDKVKVRLKEIEDFRLT